MEIKELIKHSLTEDIPTIDITSDLLIPNNTHGNANIIAKESGVFFGHPVISEFQKLTPELDIQEIINDGDIVKNKTICVKLAGPLSTIVKIERVLLNFLQKLSGIATTTAAFVNALDNPNIKICDTRKTTPLFRSLEKQAVIAGGGHNHRFGLSDMILVKENHLISYIKNHNINEFNQKLSFQKHKHPRTIIEVEVSSLDTLKCLDDSPIDIILFDNMSLKNLNSCIDYLKNKNIMKEVSGNITLTNIHQYKHMDIDRISIGCLTHSVKSLDLSLLVQ